VRILGVARKEKVSAPDRKAGEKVNFFLTRATYMQKKIKETAERRRFQLKRK